MGRKQVTLGNHAWDNREVFEFIDDAKYLARPANFPEGTPGKGLIFVNCNGTEVYQLLTYKDVLSFLRLIVHSVKWMN